MGFGINTNITSAKFTAYLYNRIKSIVSSFTVSSILKANRESVQIATDYDGSNPVFTNSAVDFLVFYGGTNQTLNWTISVDSVSNCTVNQVNNTVTVTGISAAEASYTMKAERTGYTTITKTIQVSTVANGELFHVVKADRDNIAIPTDGTGNNPDFTGASIDFKVLLGEIDQTVNWNAAIDSSSNVTVGISGTTTKTATVSAIAADSGEFVVRFTRAGYADITKQTYVHKAKDGADGTYAPDGTTIKINVSDNLEVDYSLFNDQETIILDGSSKYKVNRHKIIEDSEYTNCLILGDGTLSKSSPTNSELIENGVFVTDSDVQTNGLKKPKIIGENINFASTSPSGTSFNNPIVIGNDIIVRRNSLPSGTFASTDNSVSIGVNTSGESAVEGYTSDNSVSIGICPDNPLPNSTSVSLSRTSSMISSGINHNNTYFTGGYETSIGAGTVNIDLDLYTTSIVFANNVFKIRVNLLGVETLATNNGFFQEDIVTVFAGNIIRTTNIESGIVTGSFTIPTSVTYSIVSSRYFRVSIANTYTSTSQWNCNFKIDHFGQ